MNVAQPHLGHEEIAAAVRVLRGGHVVQGAEVAAFEFLHEYDHAA